MSRIRSFVAAALPEEVRADLERLQERLRASGVEGKWVRPGAMHLTLRFLGHLDPPIFESVQEALGPPLAVGGPLRLQAQGVGVFPSPRRARVLWVGLTGDTAQLARAALHLEARLEPLGIEREDRPFRPHLTLARSRDPSGIRGAGRGLDQEAGYCGPSFTVSEVVLFESRLHPSGPEYIERTVIPLT